MPAGRPNRAVTACVLVCLFHQNILVLTCYSQIKGPQARYVSVIIEINSICASKCTFHAFVRVHSEMNTKHTKYCFHSKITVFTSVSRFIGACEINETAWF